MGVRFRLIRAESRVYFADNILLMLPKKPLTE
jgi:hypothetical protein